MNENWRKVEIGNPRGRIALYLDESEAIDLAYHYAHDDGFHRELLDAVARAYPPIPERESLGISIRVGRDDA